MNKIVYKVPEGTIAIVTPNEGARNASKAILTDGTIVEASKVRPEVEALAADQLVGPWPPPEGTEVFWAETEEQFLLRILVKDVPAGQRIGAVMIDPANIPTDRTFRNAWALEGNRVVVDMPMARAVHLEKIRLARNEKIAKLDGPWMRAMGRGQTAEAAQIEARREELRALPEVVNLELATTPEELKAIWPAILT